MVALSIQELLKTDLPGCNYLIKDIGNFNTLTESIKLRLTGLYGWESSKKITFFIIDRSSYCNDREHEYIINQMQWAVRTAIVPNFNHEKQVLNAWIAKVMTEKGTDYALDYMKKIMEHRVEIMRKFF